MKKYVVTIEELPQHKTTAEAQAASRQEDREPLWDMEEIREQNAYFINKHSNIPKTYRAFVEGLINRLEEPF